MSDQRELERREDVVGGSGDCAATRRVKATLLDATALPVRSINAPMLLPGIDFSDHLSRWREGYSALTITDTAFLRSAHYHGAGDTAETLDDARMAKVVQGVFALTQQVPNALSLRGVGACRAALRLSAARRSCAPVPRCGHRGPRTCGCT